MSLHEVVIELLYGGFPKTETDRDRLIEAVRQDQAAQVERDRPVVLQAPEAVPESTGEARFDPVTGVRLS